MLCNEDCAIQKSDPSRRDRDYLDSEGNASVLYEIGDVWTELRMGEQPVIKSSVSAQEQCGGKQKQRSGRKYGKKGTQDSQSQ